MAYPERIDYYFTDSPRDIGRVIWKEDFPCNGVALCGRNKIYAVYTENIKCIGPHEDAHLISSMLGFPESDFVAEGMAMLFDESWWGCRTKHGLPTIGQNVLTYPWRICSITLLSLKRTAQSAILLRVHLASSLLIHSEWSGILIFTGTADVNTMKPFALLLACLCGR